ncbi:MAG: type II toxin-antitoxin system death-on-curing family toxin [Deltaproteobacteria bacterium]|nr:type II toxin-antitoxin system death-on-curing family toxin [Deltaproteobacteria bacterium]
MIEGSVWIRDDVVMAVHERQLAEHGGAQGIRDASDLKAALLAPLETSRIDDADLASVASAYGYQLVTRHPFMDGNRRTAYVCIRLFLVLNGRDIVAKREDKSRIMLKLAQGTVTHIQLASWIRRHLTDTPAATTASS